jgi:hypothetical protein
VRLAIDAPDQVRILRAELACWEDDSPQPDQDGKPNWSSAGEPGLELEQARR